MSYLSKRDKEEMADGALPVALDPVFQGKYPAIYDYLTLQKDDEGKRRTTATLTISLHQGAWKANLNDRQDEFSLFVTADTVEAAIEALEAALKAPKAPWRKNPWAERQHSKKKGQ